jgi:hypothetical protein
VRNLGANESRSTMGAQPDAVCNNCVGPASTPRTAGTPDTISRLCERRTKCRRACRPQPPTDGPANRNLLAGKPLERARQRPGEYNCRLKCVNPEDWAGLPMPIPEHRARARSTAIR